MKNVSQEKKEKVRMGHIFFFFFFLTNGGGGCKCSKNNEIKYLDTLFKLHQVVTPTCQNWYTYRREARQEYDGKC